jgi:hypothetical protein
MEFSFPTNSFLIEKYGRTPRARRNVAEVFDHDHDCRFLVNLLHDFSGCFCRRNNPIVLVPSGNAR